MAVKKKTAKKKVAEKKKATPPPAPAKKKEPSKLEKRLEVLEKAPKLSEDQLSAVGRFCALAKENRDSIHGLSTNEKTLIDHVKTLNQKVGDFLAQGQEPPEKETPGEVHASARAKLLKELTYANQDSKDLLKSIIDVIAPQ